MSRTKILLLMILLTPLLSSCHRMTSVEIADRDRAQAKMAERFDKSAVQHETALNAYQKDYWSVSSMRQRQDKLDAQELARAVAEGIELEKEAKRNEDAIEATKIRDKAILDIKIQLEADKQKEDDDIAVADAQSATEPKLRRLTVLFEPIGRVEHKSFSGEFKFIFCFGNYDSLVDPLTSKIVSVNGKQASNNLDFKLSDDQMRIGEIAIQASIVVPVVYGDMYTTETLKSSLTTTEGNKPCDKKLKLKNGNIIFNNSRFGDLGKIRMNWELTSPQ